MPVPTLVRGIPGRHYVWPPGKVPPDLVVPSVTNILDEYAKPWLGPWMAKAAGEYTADNLDTLVALDRDAVADVVTRASKRSSSAAMARGSEIHEAVDSFLSSGVHGSDLAQVEAAVDFVDRCVEEVLYHEATIFSVEYQYAGTADLIVVLRSAAPVPPALRGRTAVIDWKSGKVYPEVALQLTAYSRGDFVVNEEGEDEDLPAIDLGVVVQLPESGIWAARPVELSDDIFRAFVALRTLAKYRAYIEPDAIGKAWKRSKADKETE